MQFEEFVQSAIKTESDYQAISAWTTCDREILTTDSATHDVRILHGVFGLVTEAGELSQNFNPPSAFRPMDVENLKEEIGDLLWYCAIITDAMMKQKAEYPNLDIFNDTCFSVSVSDEVNVADIVHKLFIETSKMVDRLKRFLFYGKEFEMLLFTQHFSDVGFYIRELCAVYGFKLGDIMAANIAKLRARYPDKFDTDRAYSRDLEAERAAAISSVALTPNQQKT